MSYILEALKKAQAERQLGSAPTLHAMPLHAAAAVPVGRKRLMWIVPAVLAAVAALVLLGWQWRAPPAPVAAPPLIVAAAPAPAPALPAPAPAPALPAPAPAQLAPIAAPVAHAEAPPRAVQTPKPAKPAPPANADERLPALRELPEAVQRSVPPVVFGGYIYSSNPADRLLLIDKVLRHEGEEVAPGLVLEALQPKAAVMNYRGTRYRVAY